MKISALVAEFNPLHQGHKYIIDSMHSLSDAVIAIMSGNFVQRGECALYEKHDRANAAISCGVDLVLELPAVYSLSSAEGFAKGAVEILERTEVVDSLHFGSECGDIKLLSACADVLNSENEKFQSVLGEKLSEGLSFPAARQAALKSIIGNAAVTDMPNNILAVEYIRVLKKLSSKISPITIKRVGCGYNDTDTNSQFPSASGIREKLRNGESIKEYMLYNYESSPTFMNRFDVMVSARLKAVSKEELCLIPDCNEEIAVRLKDASIYNTFEEIIEAASCRCYTQSRLRRILCNMIIGNHFKTLPAPTYIRPLAFNKMGSNILKKMKTCATLPIASRGAMLKEDSLFSLERRATDIYNLAHNIKGGREFSDCAKIFE